MSISKNEFMQYLKTGKVEKADESNGGYLIPPYVMQPRSGILGYLARLIKNDYGWIKIDMYKIIKNEIAQMSVISRVKK